MIDDFRVPGDDGYGYDDYGSGKKIEIDYIKDIITKYKLKIFSPKISSSQETGEKRGCAILLTPDIEYSQLNESDLLREYII